MYCPSKDVYFEDGGRKYNVVDGDGKQIEKELFLYFLIDENAKTVPRAMKTLLRKVGRENILECIGLEGNLDSSSLIYVDRGDADMLNGN